MQVMSHHTKSVNPPMTTPKKWNEIDITDRSCFNLLLFSFNFLGLRNWLNVINWFSKLHLTSVNFCKTYEINENDTIQNVPYIHITLDNADSFTRPCLQYPKLVNSIVIADSNHVSSGKACKVAKSILQHCFRIRNIQELDRLWFEF